MGETAGMSASKAAIVTGSSRGIGAAVARVLAREGYDVCVNYVRDEAAAERVAGDVRAAGRRAVTVQADTGREADIVRMFEAAEAALGSVDALVNNAGVSGARGLVEEVTAETLDAVFRVNVAGYFLCAREAIRRMSTKHGGRGGRIVNVSSIAADRTGAFEWVHYGASKAAVDTFTRGLALETADQGIRCNSVRPGMVDTDIHWPGRMEAIAPTIPLKRIADPEEVAEAVAWLLSDKASYCTGTHIDVAGGRM